MDCPIARGGGNHRPPFTVNDEHRQKRRLCHWAQLWLSTPHDGGSLKFWSPPGWRFTTPNSIQGSPVISGEPTEFSVGCFLPHISPKVNRLNFELSRFFHFGIWSFGHLPTSPKLGRLPLYEFRRTPLFPLWCPCRPIRGQGGTLGSVDSGGGFCTLVMWGGCSCQTFNIWAV